MDTKFYKHYVITRFNIRVNYKCQLKNLDNNPMKRILDTDYLNERFNIFEKYTLQSMKRQTNQNFQWIVLFHENTPDIFKNRIQKLKNEFNFIDLYFSDNQSFNFLEYCNSRNESVDYYITTRIDNDDMFSDDYIARIQEYANNNFHECIISFEKGMKFDLSSQKKYEFERKDNHFLSMIGKKEDCILQYNHTKIFDSGKEIVMLDSSKPMWIEIIHESNVTNRIKDRDKEIEKQVIYGNYDKKILVSDYDQTLYLNDDDIAKNKIAINKFREKGNIFVIATGRSYFDFHCKVDLYKLNYDYVIINHGATILDKDNNLIANFSIRNEAIPDIKNDLQLKKSIKGFCCSGLESRVDFDYNDLTKINVKYNSKDVAMNINKYINDKYSEFVNSYYVTENSVEIISNKINKSKAIDFLLSKLNILKENVYTIGDGYSDIEMIKDFNGYSMKNSVDELKEVAKKEYNSVSELINDII